ncbi:MOSC domain-containing protein [Paroceanicella profunda]|uniref:MOSC domain-containing protein n=1 Tax=Paroceanicella profunda TaxID=2579971 RepID=A0A5B8FTB1_9RHOB|nr:MOSC N-terminal beta barrel domain-containing protein [Paroceanicella profunda]QDL90574.1 MOSC domain-containing protein [Paroceanicella profunda]
MAARLATIYRHPVKSLGVEELGEVRLLAGQTMPGDRTWAVAHEASKFDPAAPDWAHCANFARVAKAPQLGAVTARLAEDGETVTFTHPARPALTARPDSAADAARILAWMAPLVPAGRARPAAIARAPGRGMTDSDFPSVSLGSLSSLHALSKAAHHVLSPVRFRMNFWFEGTPPWEEFDWVGHQFTLGGARLRVAERVGRCSATTANPETGEVDIDTLKLLREGWGHTQFGVYAEVVEPGLVRVGDTLAHV